MAEPTTGKLPAHLRDDLKFKPGQSGNPNGRPKGARNKLGEVFLEALHDDFKDHGVKAIEKVRTDRPHEYLKVIAQTLPRDINLKVGELDDLTDDQIQRQLAAGLAALAAAGFDVGQGTGPASAPEPSGGVSSVH